MHIGGLAFENLYSFVASLFNVGSSRSSLSEPQHLHLKNGQMTAQASQCHCNDKKVT